MQRFHCILDEVINTRGASHESARCHLSIVGLSITLVCPSSDCEITILNFNDISSTALPCTYYYSQHNNMLHIIASVTLLHSFCINIMPSTATVTCTRQRSSYEIDALHPNQPIMKFWPVNQRNDTNNTNSCAKTNSLSLHGDRNQLHTHHVLHTHS